MLVAVIATALLFSSSLAPVQARVLHTPTPVATPAFPDCDRFDIAVPGDTCDAMIYRADIPADEFYRLNPSIGGFEGCNQGRLLAMMWYCINAVSPPAPTWTAIVPIDKRAEIQSP